MKRKWFALAVMALMVWSLVGSTAAQGSFPQTPVLDDFNRSDGGLGENWTSNDLIVVDQQCGSNFSDGGNGVWNTEYGPDSEAYLTITVMPEDGDFVRMMVRYDTSSETNYYVDWTRDDVEGDVMTLYAAVDGEYSSLGSVEQDMSAGDSMRLRAVGSAVSVHYKSGGGGWTQVLSVSDSSVTDSGHLQVIISDETIRVDNFGGGTLVVEPATPTPTPPVVIPDIEIDLDFDAIMEYVNMILAGLTGLFEALIGIALGYAVAARLVRVWRGG